MKEGQPPSAAALQKLDIHLGVLDTRLGAPGPYVLGPKPCVADYTLACALETYRCVFGFGFFKDFFQIVFNENC